jgi:hypothetical protein
MLVLTNKKIALLPLVTNTPYTDGRKEGRKDIVCVHMADSLNVN